MNWILLMQAGLGKCQHAKADLSDFHPDRYSGVAPG